MQRVYEEGLLGLASGFINWTGDTIKVALYDDQQDLSAEVEFIGDVSATEFAGAGYARASVTSRTIDLDASGVHYRGEATFTSLSAGSYPLLQAIYYKEVTTDGNSPVICVGGWSVPQTPTGVNVYLMPNEGVMVLKG